MTLAPLSDSDLAIVAGGWDDDGDSGSFPDGEDQASGGAGINWMMELTCTGVAIAVEGPAAIAGTVAGFGLRGVALAAPNLLPYLASTIGVSLTQDYCRNAGGGTDNLGGDVMGSVGAP